MQSTNIEEINGVTIEKVDIPEIESIDYPASEIMAKGIESVLRKEGYRVFTFIEEGNEMDLPRILRNLGLKKKDAEELSNLLEWSDLDLWVKEIIRRSDKRLRKVIMLFDGSYNVVIFAVEKRKTKRGKESGSELFDFSSFINEIIRWLESYERTVVTRKVKPYSKYAEVLRELLERSDLSKPINPISIFTVLAFRNATTNLKKLAEECYELYGRYVEVNENLEGYEDDIVKALKGLLDAFWKRGLAEDSVEPIYFVLSRSFGCKNIFFDYHKIYSDLAGAIYMGLNPQLISIAKEYEKRFLKTVATRIVKSYLEHAEKDKSPLPPWYMSFEKLFNVDSKIARKMFDQLLRGFKYIAVLPEKLTNYSCRGVVIIDNVRYEVDAYYGGTDPKHRYWIYVRKIE